MITPNYDYFSKLVDNEETNVRQVAMATGVPQSTLSEWKSGKCCPKVDKIMKLANYFGVSVENFYE